jgi:hypothetical protein
MNSFGAFYNAKNSKTNLRNEKGEKLFQIQ